MIEQLLRLLAQGGLRSYQDLAAALSVSPPLLEAMLENLARLGYLRAVDSCAGQCHGCGTSGCSAAGPAHVWALTDTGARAAARDTQPTT